MYDGDHYLLSYCIVNPSSKALSLVHELRSQQRLSEYVRVHLRRAHILHHGLPVLHSVRYPEISDVNVAGSLDRKSVV